MRRRRVVRSVSRSRRPPARSVARRRRRGRDEADALRAIVSATTAIVALDERGRALDSPGFAVLLGAARDGGHGELAVVIGGADGLDPEYRHGADHVIAFGAMTWPHQLVRVMAAEQIYRAVTILAGHPYHRV